MDGWTSLINCVDNQRWPADSIDKGWGGKRIHVMTSTLLLIMCSHHNGSSCKNTGIFSITGPFVRKTHGSLVDFTHNIYLLFDPTRSSWFETPWRPCDVTVLKIKMFAEGWVVYPRTSGSPEPTWHEARSCKVGAIFIREIFEMKHIRN